VDFPVCQAQLSGQDRFRLAKFRENGINKTNIFNLQWFPEKAASCLGEYLEGWARCGSFCGISRLLDPV